MIGAAFGIGFVLGPLLGGLLMKVPVPHDWQIRVPFLVAAVFSTFAWVLVLLRLPESLPKGGEARTEARVISWRGILDTIRHPQIGGLVAVGSLSVEPASKIYDLPGRPGTKVPNRRGPRRPSSTQRAVDPAATSPTGGPEWTSTT